MENDSFPRKAETLAPRVPITRGEPEELLTLDQSDINYYFVRRPLLINTSCFTGPALNINYRSLVEKWKYILFTVKRNKTKDIAVFADLSSSLAKMFFFF